MNRAFLHRVIVLVCWLLVLPQLAVGQTDIVVRTAVEPEDHVLVGQKIKFTIDVFAKDAWASLPQLPQIEIQGSIVYLPSGQSLRLSETIDGDSYTGQRYQWWVYPRRPGTVSIKSIDVEVNQKSFGVNAESIIHSTQTKPLKLNATYPEGIRSADDLVCAESLQVSDTWNPIATEPLKIGDGLTRTISRTISGAPGMLLPNLSPENIEGIEAYPKQPEVSDTSNRGSLMGRRTDAVTYVFKTSGSFTFPAQEFIWWNESAKQLETVELPQQTFEVLATEIAPESSATEINDNQSSKPKSQSLPAWIAASLFLVVALYLSRHWTNMKYHELLNSPFIQERKTFRALVAAAQSKNIDETMHRLYRWTDFPLHDCDAPQIRVLLERFGSASDTIQIQKLLSGESSGNWNSDDFIRACRSIRKNWRHNKVQVDQQQTSALPKLNP